MSIIWRKIRGQFRDHFRDNFRSNLKVVFVNNCATMRQFVRLTNYFRDYKTLFMSVWDVILGLYYDILLSKQTSYLCKTGFVKNHNIFSPQNIVISSQNTKRPIGHEQVYKTKGKNTHLNFLTFTHMFVLWDGIGDNYSFKTGRIDSRQSRSRENAMRQNCVYFRCTRF